MLKLIKVNLGPFFLVTSRPLMVDCDTADGWDARTFDFFKICLETVEYYFGRL